MHGYKGFINDVKEEFDWLINSHQTILEGRTDKDFGEYCVELKLKRCILNFDLDRLDLQGKLINPQNRKEYHIVRVFELLFGCEFEYLSPKLSKVENVRVLLKVYSEKLKMLVNVLEGDFSWSEKYEESENDEKWLVGKVFELPYDHPISKKFWSGDLSWKSDLLNEK